MVELRVIMVKNTNSVTKNKRKFTLDTVSHPVYIPVKAEPHTPPYKIHKYFARRPWNVFNQLVKNFSNENDIILDPFCGGGVTVYEGLKNNRKIIGCDLNPLSIFVVKNMVKKVEDSAELLKAFDLCEGYIEKLYKDFNRFTFENENIRTEWSEIAFVVKCFYCNNEIVLSNDNKVKNGVYKCSNLSCPNLKDGVEARLCERSGIKYLFNVGHNSIGKKIVKPFDDSDEKKLKKHLNFLHSEIKDKNVEIPKDKIPLNWDRQLEDQLAKKGVIHFQDLFTERNLLLNLLLLNFIQSLKKVLSQSEYELLRIAFSNLVKDNNIMSFTNDTWQSGKPTTWSKHAYWVPSQFCEVNIDDVFRKSKQRVISTINHNNGFDYVPEEINSHSDFAKSGNLLLWNKSIVDLNLPANSVDAIITDPPYGSNVQYLELSHFWYPWNKDLYKVVPDFKLEAVSNRKKNFEGAKSMYDYEENLYKVFKKTFDVLKPEKHMVLTFNNKNINAWMALLFSIFRAGFTLEKDGIYFQDGVKNYKQTAHTKYEGSPYGDFIYVFKKSDSNLIKINHNNEKEFWGELDGIFKSYSEKNDDKNDSIKKMFLEAIPVIEAFSKNYLANNKKHTLYSTLNKDYFDYLYA
jgi:adenine-specific DNA methylase